MCDLSDLRLLSFVGCCGLLVVRCLFVLDSCLACVVCCFVFRVRCIGVCCLLCVVWRLTIVECRLMCVVEFVVGQLWFVI